MLNSLPPEILALISSGITSLFALVIRWLEIKLFKAKLRNKDSEVESLQSTINDLKSRIGQNI